MMSTKSEQKLPFIMEAVHDPVTRFIYADWLDEYASEILASGNDLWRGLAMQRLAKILRGEVVSLNGLPKKSYVRLSAETEMVIRWDKSRKFLNKFGKFRQRYKNKRSQHLEG